MRTTRLLPVLALAATPGFLFAQGRGPGHSIGKVDVIGNLIHIELDSGAVDPDRLLDLDHRTLRFTPDGAGYRIENVNLNWDSNFGDTAKVVTPLKNFAFPFSGKQWDTLRIATGGIAFGPRDGLTDGGGRRGGGAGAGAGAAGRAGAAGGAAAAGGRGRGGRGGGRGAGGGRAAGGAGAAGAAAGGGRAAQAPGRGSPGAGNNTGAGINYRTGFPLERYSELRSVAEERFINDGPGIAAFVRISNNSPVAFFKELPDRAVVTWDVGETIGGTQAFTWVPVHNHYQATLYKNGVIELSYNGMNAKDGIVGVFPMVTEGKESSLGTVTDGNDASAAPNLDIKSVKLSSIDGLFLKATIETRGPVLQDGDPNLNGVTYRIALDKGNAGAADITKATAVWTIRGAATGRGGRGGPTRYSVSGPGAQSQVTVSGNTISVEGVLPEQLAGVARVSVSADAGTSTGVGVPVTVADAAAPTAVALGGVRAPEIDLSAAKKSDGPYRVAYEPFHWMENPSSTNVACTVINALGDNFDLLASYSTFRVDNPEGGTPSTGPRGGGEWAVQGIGSSPRGAENYCSKGRFQWMFVEPVSTSAIQIQEKAPAEAGPRLNWMTDYNYAVSQIAHELGHRWAADAHAILANGDTIDLGPTHWGGNVHLAAAFPYGQPDGTNEEADLMGGSYWKDNGDGTFTQLNRDFYSPAKGYAWMPLYLMGLAKPDEVPPFFVLLNEQGRPSPLERVGQDAAGHPIVKAKKVVVTVQDVIRAMGPRVPDFDHAQKHFNTAMVVITRPGEHVPPPFLIQSVNNISQHWSAYWTKVTGGRSTMTTDPHPTK